MSDAVMTESAQETARRWIDADIERAGRLSLLVSGEAEQDEILTTIRAMIEAKDAEIARLRAALQEAKGLLPIPRPHKANEAWTITCIRDALAVIDRALNPKE